MDFSNPLNVWWTIMVAFNVLSLFVYVCWFFKSIKTDALEPENKKYKSIMRILGAVFVFVSMYRSIFVSSYPNRLSWFNTMANSPLIIRIFATFAEISFALLIMIPLIHLNHEMPADCKFTKTKFGKFIVNKGPYIIFICLFTAQFFAYSGLFTQHLTLFAIEETLWGLGFLSIAPAAICHAVCVFRDHKNEKAYKFVKVYLVVLCTFTVGYLLYQFLYSLPVGYYSQLAEDLAKPHLSGMEAINSAIYKFTASRDYNTWGGIGFFIWHSGYFSVCTWMNMLYAMAPRKLERD